MPSLGNVYKAPENQFDCDQIDLGMRYQSESLDISVLMYGTCAQRCTEFRTPSRDMFEAI